MCDDLSTELILASHNKQKQTHFQLLLKANQISIPMKRVFENTNQMTAKLQNQPRWPLMFQKYGLIRLNDLIINKQLSLAFKQMKTKETLPKQVQIDCLPQEQKYKVNVEVIRPQLKGEIIIQKRFDIANLPIKRNKKIEIIKIQRQHYENINLIDAQFKTKEMDLEIENIKKLLILQSVQRQQLITPKVIINSRNRISNIYILSIILLLILLCSDC